MKPVDALDFDGFTIKDPKHDAIPRTPEERKLDRLTSAWFRKEKNKRQQKARDRVRKAKS